MRSMTVHKQHMWKWRVRSRGIWVILIGWRRLRHLLKVQGDVRGEYGLLQVLHQVAILLGGQVGKNVVALWAKNRVSVSQRTWPHKHGLTGKWYRWPFWEQNINTLFISMGKTLFSANPILLCGTHRRTFRREHTWRSDMKGWLG